MKYILVARGITPDEYLRIRQDIVDQIKAQGYTVPIFANLPGDYAELDVVWIDEELERSNFTESLKASTFTPSSTVIQTLADACQAALEDGENYKLSEVVKQKLREAIKSAGYTPWSPGVEGAR